MNPSPTGLSTCGCCEPLAPPERSNRPGLTEVAYRVGTHSTLLQAMTDRLSLETVAAGPHAGSRPLAALGTRDPADPAIALLDAAATMLDVLTFYAERIANEGFLGTATERRSVLHLARAIGYELGPGVAADATLVFTLAQTPGTAPSHALIPAGTRVQSLPVGGALPQTFETVDDFVSHRAWNTLRPRTRYPQTVLVASDGGIERLDVDGTPQATDEIVLTGTARSLAPGDLLVVHFNAGTTVLRVTAVTEDTRAALTHLTVELPDGAVTVPSSLLDSSSPVVLTGASPMSMTDTAVAEVVATELTESQLQVLLADRQWDPTAFLDAVRAVVATPAPKPLPFKGVFVLRTRVGLFGHTAQPWASLPVSQRLGEWHDTAVWDATTKKWILDTRFVPGIYQHDWEQATVWTTSQGVTYAEADLFLARDVDAVLDEGWIVLAGNLAGGLTRQVRAYRIDDRRTATLADYGITGEVTALDLQNPRQDPPDKPAFLVRRTAAHVASEWLQLADVAIDDPVGGDTVELDTMVLGLTLGQSVVVSGPLSDPSGVTGTEVAVIEAVTHRDGRTTLEFTEGLTGSYVRDTVELRANVVRATHGETVEQPLGGGDAAVANQTFALRRAPLTYVAAATPTGSASTLEVRVGGRRWDEVRSLYGAASADQVYTVRIADDATATVTFGDGVSGARPPTGTENITAVYRTGTGPDGEVDARTIELLTTRPPGVESVTNPLPAAGAAAPETLASARANAPMTVRTLDRVVSLTDFEDFAATFAGIGKARADVLRLHGARLVHLTIGSASGGVVADDKVALLREAIDALRDPGESVCVSSYRPLAFDVIGGVRTDPALARDAVMEAVRKALTAAFSFAARRFGQGVSVAEVMQVLHDVEGVLAVDIDRLAVSDSTQEPVEVPPLGVLTAQPARVAAGATVLGCRTVEPADLLVINPGGIDLDRAIGKVTT